MNPSPLTQALQLLVVTTGGWDACSGELRRFARPEMGAPWRQLGARAPVSVGRAGLAWGIGLHPPMPGLTKCEGDGRAPAGIFAITGLFGDARGAAALPAPALPWQMARPCLKCVDDPGSRHYNRIVDADALSGGDWHSCEEMLRDDSRYALGAVIDHNPAALPGAGSCIFLHVWEAPGVATAGCTAGSFEMLAELCRWLDARAAPVLVQLPEAIYRRQAVAWGLPDAADSRGGSG